MKTNHIILSAAALLMLAGCQSGASNSVVGFVTGQKTVEFTGPMVTRTIDAKNFSEIRTQQSIIVNYTQSPVYSVTCTAPEDAWEYLSIATDGDKLVCEFDKISIRNRNNSKRVVVNVSGPMVTDFHASSSGVINVSALDAASSDVEIDVSSSGAISISSLKCRQLDVDASSSAAVAVNSVEAAKIDVDGSSSAAVNVSGKCADASLSFSSSAEAEADITATGEIEVEANSSATIKLSGSARTVDFHASSSGSIDAAGLRAERGKLSASSSGSIESNVANPDSHTSSAGSISNR